MNELSSNAPELPGLRLPEERCTIAALSAAAQRAVVAPAEPGGWSTSWRSAVAARIAALHGNTQLAESYRGTIVEVDETPVCDPNIAGRDPREIAALGFLDAVSTCPRDVSAGDLADLQAAGVSDADIVRLCELAAFLAYQCRIATALATLEGRAA